jgi:DNA-directed RNA polymerase subunit M/transcription elongation factor TFIIS
MQKTGRTCPKCGSGDYLFRSRKNIEAAEGPIVETKYRCRPCSHEWKERIPKTGHS